MKRAFLSLFLFAAACGGKSSGSGTPAIGGTCESAASNIATAIPDLDDAGMTEVANAIGEICVSDGWSASAIGCFSAAGSTQDEMKPCADELTAAQQDSLGSQMAARAGEGEEDPMDDDPEEPAMDDSELDDTEAPE